MESEKELRVLAAAKTVFLRHGFRRVTMQDIADEAGISRPALYLIHPNKEEVFLAVVGDFAAKNLEFIRGDLWTHPTTESKLHFAFEVWAVEPFRLMLDSPDAKDLVDCTQSFAKEFMDKANAEFEALLVEILSPVVRTPGDQHGRGERIGGRADRASAGLLHPRIQRVCPEHAGIAHHDQRSDHTDDRGASQPLVRGGEGLTLEPALLDYSPGTGAAPAPPTR